MYQKIGVQRNGMPNLTSNIPAFENDYKSAVLKKKVKVDPLFDPIRNTLHQNFLANSKS